MHTPASAEQAWVRAGLGVLLPSSSLQTGACCPVSLHWLEFALSFRGAPNFSPSPSLEDWGDRLPSLPEAHPPGTGTRKDLGQGPASSAVVCSVFEGHLCSWLRLKPGEPVRAKAARAEPVLGMPFVAAVLQAGPECSRPT